MPVASQRWVDELALPERAAVLAWMWDAQSEGVVLLGEDFRVLQDVFGKYTPTF
jgi:hypothetical protein